MDAVFIELPAFERYRPEYLDDEVLQAVQQALMSHPECGDLIEGTGGLRKMRWVDQRRGKGKRGGLRIIYFWWEGMSQFWLFTLYGKDEMTDLGPAQRAQMKTMVKAEMEARK